MRIPALMRDLTDGQERVAADGQTVGEVIDSLEAAHPGVKARLLPDGALSPALSVAVDGRLGRLRLLEPVQAQSQISFVPAIAGG
ncbi:MAG: MoaD/ThiS family protein [Anaerolineae bacterium]